MDGLVQIDGSLFQGGGQMIRSSLALATILQKQFRIHSIRKNRPNPGINNQLRSVFSAFSQKVPKVGDTEVYIYPKFNSPSVLKCSTAASCTLMLQCLVPTCTGLGYDKEIKIQGGSDVSRSPPLQSLRLGLIGLMKRMDVDLDIIDVKKGYYPTGNGYVKFEVKKTQFIKPISFVKFAPPTRVQITYYVKQNKLPNSSKDFRKDILKLLEKHFPQTKVKIQCKVQKVFKTKDNYGIGCMVYGEGAIWDVGTVGQKRLDSYAQKKVCLDQHHQDQLLLLSSLATGTSYLHVGQQLSLHTKSLLYVIKSFIPQFKYKHQEGILQIQGIGHKCIE